MSVYLGPAVDRWNPTSWSDVVTAAVAGTLDETRWLELKKDLPPADRKGTTELAKDLAAMACEGGVLILGITDDHGRAGEVTGIAVAGVQDRLDQVAGRSIDPPVVLRTVVLEHPTEVGRGCLLVLLDRSAHAPHMVDGHYWGRGDTGKRRLSDHEVRHRIAENAQQQQTFSDVFLAAQSRAAIGGTGVLHVLFRPRSGRPGALGSDIDRARQLWHELTVSLPSDAGGWLRGDLETVTRVVHGTQLSNFSAAAARGLDLRADASSVPYPLQVAQIYDDSTLLMSCSKLTYLGGADIGIEQPVLSTQGVLAITERATLVAGRLAHRAGYAGTWDAGIALSGIEGTAAAPEQSGRFPGLYGQTFAEDDYQGHTATTTTELLDAPYDVLDRLLRPIFRVLGTERQIEALRPLSS